MTEHKRLTFDPTINAGHILTFIVGLAAGFGAWSTLDKRVVVLEEAKAYQQRRDDAQDLAIGVQLQDIKAAIKDVQRGVEQLARDQRSKP